MSLLCSSPSHPKENGMICKPLGDRYCCCMKVEIHFSRSDLRRHPKPVTLFDSFPFQLMLWKCSFCILVYSPLSRCQRCRPICSFSLVIRSTVEGICCFIHQRSSRAIIPHIYAPNYTWSQPFNRLTTTKTAAFLCRQTSSRLTLPACRRLRCWRAD